MWKGTFSEFTSSLQNTRTKSPHLLFFQRVEVVHLKWLFWVPLSTPGSATNPCGVGRSAWISMQISPTPGPNSFSSKSPIPGLDLSTQCKRWGKRVLLVPRTCYVLLGNKIGDMTKVLIEHLLCARYYEGVYKMSSYFILTMEVSRINEWTKSTEVIGLSQCYEAGEYWGQFQLPICSSTKRMNIPLLRKFL